jgi:hypothetical protein
VQTKKVTFQSQPRWRQFLRRPLPSPLVQCVPNLLLKSSFCDLLLEVPGLLSEASRLHDLDQDRLHDESEVNHQRQVFIVRVIAFYHDLEAWYSQNLSPMLRTFRLLINQSSHSSGDSFDSSRCVDVVATYEYPDHLVAALDCVSNSILVRIQTLLMEMIALWLSPLDEHEEFFCQHTVAERQVIAREAHGFVKKTSTVAVKLLEYGLEQIWTRRDFVTLFRKS